MEAASTTRGAPEGGREHCHRGAASVRLHVWPAALSSMGDSRARDKAEDEEKQRWTEEVATFFMALQGTLHHGPGGTDVSAARMCLKVRASTLAELHACLAPTVEMVAERGEPANFEHFPHSAGPGRPWLSSRKPQAKAQQVSGTRASQQC